MTTIINAVASTGLTQTADGSGIIKLQSNSVTTNALAWVNFGYVSSAITVRANYNVSSVTRSSTGVYVINFSTALADANYVPVLSIGNFAGSGGCVGGNSNATRTTTSLTIQTTNAAQTTFTDTDPVYVAIFGN